MKVKNHYYDVDKEYLEPPYTYYGKFEDSKAKLAKVREEAAKRGYEIEDVDGINYNGEPLYKFNPRIPGLFTLQEVTNMLLPNLAVIH